VHKIAALSVPRLLAQASIGRRGPKDLPFRVLEIGAGTGSVTEAVLAQLQALGLPYEYTFTDVYPLFLKLAAEKFTRQQGGLRFKVLDIETDPKAQGFAPHSYDLVLADSVLHATRNLRASLAIFSRPAEPCSL